MENALSILVVDDEIINLKNIQHFLIRQGFVVQIAENGRIAMQLIESENFDLVLTDLKMEGVDGNQVMAFSKKMLPHAEVIIMTGYATINSAVTSMADGAYYYLPKPIKLHELKTLINKALEHIRLRREVSQLKQQILDQKGGTQFIGHTPAILKLKDDIALFAQLDCNVLIIGETGTGKELVARTIHELSPRSEGPFIPINCATLTEDLAQNEMFGHEKDAYTGASQTQQGLFEAADGGVVLLDEIGEMSPTIQAKMLRVLQDKKIYRVGGTREIPVNIRVLAATNRELENELKQKRFRQDLFFRLNVATLEVPPLRQRKEDIHLLTHHFLDKYQGVNNKVRAISPEALKALLQYDYPGNVRELENIIERTLAICNGPAIELHHLPQNLKLSSRDDKITGTTTQEFVPSKSLEENERDYIIHILKSTGGNKTKAAKLMGINRVSLWRKLNRYKDEGFDIERLFTS